MAKAIISIEDEGEEVNIRMEFDPPLTDKTVGAGSAAQAMALEAIAAIRKMPEQETCELNERVARAMGWHYHEDPEQASESYWTLPDGGMEDAPPFGAPREGHYGDFYSLPDFARDPMAIGYMVEWSEREAVMLNLTSNNCGEGRWMAQVWDYDCPWWESAPAPGEALARAVVRYAETPDAQR